MADGQEKKKLKGNKNDDASAVSKNTNSSSSSSSTAVTTLSLAPEGSQASSSSSSSTAVPTLSLAPERSQAPFSSSSSSSVLPNPPVNTSNMPLDNSITSGTQQIGHLHRVSTSNQTNPRHRNDCESIEPRQMTQELLNDIKGLASKVESLSKHIDTQEMGENISKAMAALEVLLENLNAAASLRLLRCEKPADSEVDDDMLNGDCDDTVFRGADNDGRLNLHGGATSVVEYDPFRLAWEMDLEKLKEVLSTKSHNVSEPCRIIKDCQWSELSVLGIAIQKKNVEMVKYCLKDLKAQISTSDLISAMKTDNFDIMPMLFDSLPENDHDYFRGLMFDSALQNNLSRVVELLLSRKRNQSTISRGILSRALIYSSSKGHINVLKSIFTPLYAEKVDINSLRKTGNKSIPMTCLMIAVVGNHLEAVKTLVQDGRADIGIRDINGKTALTHAEEEGFNEIKEFLINLSSTGKYVENNDENDNDNDDNDHDDKDYENEDPNIEKPGKGGTRDGANRGGRNEDQDTSGRNNNKRDDDYNDNMGDRDDNGKNQPINASTELSCDTNLNSNAQVREEVNVNVSSSSPVMQIEPENVEDTTCPLCKDPACKIAEATRSKYAEHFCTDNQVCGVVYQSNSCPTDANYNSLLSVFSSLVDVGKCIA